MCFSRIGCSETEWNSEFLQNVVARGCSDHEFTWFSYDLSCTTSLGDTVGFGGAHFCVPPYRFTVCSVVQCISRTALFNKVCEAFVVKDAPVFDGRFGFCSDSEGNAATLIRKQMHLLRKLTDEVLYFKDFLKNASPDSAPDADVEETVYKAMWKSDGFREKRIISST